MYLDKNRSYVIYIIRERICIPHSSIKYLFNIYV